MKRSFILIGIIIFVLSLSSCVSLKGGQGLANELVYEDIVNEIIWFHVIANSNSEEDQSLKLKVRDKVVEFVSNNLKDCKSIDDARAFIINNKSEIENIAQVVVNEEGYSYNVTSSLSVENFLDKVYGDVVFPQGEYEAYRILIGEAKGENWWCVMFPPLCFVDGTKEAVNSKEVINSLEENDVKMKSGKIQFKFKLFEVLFGNKS